MPQVLGAENCQYTVVSTNGTNTIAGGPLSIAGQPAPTQVLFGAALTVLGTAPIINIYDIIGTTTNLLLTGTGTAAGQVFTAGIPGVGIRFRGNLVQVTTGTAAGTWNTLWD